ncbi:MAG TPA: GNVR domain-containing protein [Candidatus Aquilonibacter sp.]|nr:GNVR domain-containing protein [Candidatus Aquilonibacter sp.]
MRQTISTSGPITLDVVAPIAEVSRDEGFERRYAWERAFGRLRLLWAKRKFLLKVLAVGLAAATAAAFLIPSSYQSQAQLMPPDSSSDGFLALLAGLGGQGGESGGGTIGSLASSLFGLKSTGALFIGVLQSRTVQDGIIDEFSLKRVYHVRLESGAEKRLLEKTEIDEDRKSGIITITVTDHDPRRAAGIAGGYVSELNALMANLNTSSAHRERVFLEGRLAEVSKQLESAEQSFSRFSSKNSTIDVTEQARAMLESSAMLQGQLAAAESELQGLRQIFSDNNVRVRTTEARIAELREQIQKMAGHAGAAPTDADPGSSDDPYPAVRQLPLLGVGYADNLRRVKVDEAVFEALTKEYELAKVQEAKEIPTVKVLDPPNIPQRKSFPPRTVIVVFGTIFSGILGVVWVVGDASWREVDGSDPRKAFAADVFTAIEARYPWILNRARPHASTSGDRNGSGPASGSER